MEKRNLTLDYEKKTYVKAWASYTDWYKTNGIMLSARTLFDFFDINRVFIEINPDYDFVLQQVDTNKWSYTITNNDLKLRFYGTNFSSRKLAEIAAFKDGFRILEEKIIEVEKNIKRANKATFKNLKPSPTRANRR